MRKNSILKTAFVSWRRDNAPRIGAALAYYTIFSLAPLLLILVGISKLFFVDKAAQTQLLLQVEKITGPAGGQVANAILTNTTGLTSSGGTAATIIGTVIMIIGAMAVFRQIKNSIDSIWHVNVIKRHGHIKNFLIKNLIAFIMIIGVGLLLISSFIISAIITSISSISIVIFSPTFWEIINTSIFFIVIALVFAITLKMLSFSKLKWAHIWPGAFLSSLLFIIGKFTFGLYLSFSNLGSAYGATGALIIFLFWIYYSAQIFLFGVEIVKSKFQSHP